MGTISQHITQIHHYLHLYQLYIYIYIYTYIYTYLQSFQYKILNRILNCNDRLFRWKIKTGPECDSCGMTDTLEHRLFECTEEKQIWDSLQSWIQGFLEINTKFTICEVIFGIPNDDQYVQMVNYIILNRKMVHKQKKGAK